MTREEAIMVLKMVEAHGLADEAKRMAIEALNNEPIRCEDCRHRNTWDNQRFDPQYYRCRKGVKFRDYGYVREDDYCPLGERREKNEML